MKANKLLLGLFLATFTIFTTTFFLVSCNNEKTEDVDSGSKDLVVNSVGVSAFTASISGTFRNMSKADIALGKNGVLYCLKSDKAEAVFKSWLDGEDNPDCEMIIDKKGFNGESYSGMILGLYPETEYSFCLFSQGTDASNRKISSIHSFITDSFNPEFKDLWIEDIHYIDVAVRSRVIMNANDALCCTRGVVMSETTDGNIKNAVSVTEITDPYNSEDPKFSVKAKGIKPDNSYYCRVFVKYFVAGDVEKVLYGPEQSFSTLSSENLYVDLGLPSGIKWAKCDLGEFQFNVDYYLDDLFFRWGSTELTSYYDASNVNRYEYWDASTNNYVDIGSDICNTEFDMAHVLLGGKWRQPRKNEVEELINNCNTRTFVEMPSLRWLSDSEGYYVNSTWYAGNIVAPNESKIQLQDNYNWWTGTLCEDGIHAYSFHYTAKEWESTSSQVNKGEITIKETNRERACAIRPVWDPNI